MKQNYFDKWNHCKLYPNGTRLLTLLFLIAFSINFMKAQVSAYSFSQNIGSYSSLSGATILGTATANSGAIPSLDTTSFPVTLPFGFIFNGQTYTNLTVSTNGYVTFGTGAATSTLPISSVTGWEGVISAWGRSVNAVFDIAGKTGNISWVIEGSAPNRVAVIQWENVRPVSSTSVTNAYIFSFQIRIAETTGVIQTRYSAGAYLIGSTAISSTANQIGLRGTTNLDFNNRTNSSTVPFGSSVAGALNGNGQAFNTMVDPPGMPVDGLTYTWTPPTCFGPSALSVTNITINSATISWNPSISTPANGYDIYYDTSNVAPISTTTPTVAGVAGLTQNINALTPSNTYYVWIRSVCSNTDSSNWIALPTFTTACSPITDYFENFDSYAAASIVPNCWDRIPGSGIQTISSTTPNSGTRNLYLSSTNATNQTLVVLPEFSNVNSGTHWLRFKARLTAAPNTINLGYITNPSDASTFVNIESKTITNTSYTSLDSEYTLVIPSSVVIPAGARLAIRNPGTTSTSIFIDDLYWEVAPTCFPPTNVIANNIGPTSADINWTATITPPTNGYDLYYSTTNTAPTTATMPNISGIIGNTTNISSLAPTTQYFVWVRSKCSTNDISAWSNLISFFTVCQPPTLIGTTGATVCPNNTATLTATADVGATINWYDAAGAQLATGPSFTTPSLSTTTTYYATASVGASDLAVGKTTFTANPTSGAGTTNFGLVFEVISQSILSSVTIYPISSTNAAGTVTIDLIDKNGTIIQTHTESVIGAPISAPVAHVVNLNFLLLPDTNYKIRPGSFTGITGLVFDASANAPGGNYGYPFTLAGIVNIYTSTLTAAPANTARNDLYYYFYDWKISSKCESTSQAVIATADPAACLSTVEVDGKNNINVYPNPFTDVLNISDVKGLVSVSITDMSGRTVKTISKPTAQIHLGELPSGMYLVNLKYKDGSVKTVKAIKK